MDTDPIAWSPAPNEVSANEFNRPRAASQQLMPVKIDDKYLQSNIQADPIQGSLTLKGAVEVATVHNRDVQKTKLEVSRFKWDYRAVETSRLPNVRIISYLADQTVKSELVPARANAFFFASALFPITQQYRIGLEARVAKLGQEIAAQQPAGRNRGGAVGGHLHVVAHGEGGARLVGLGIDIQPRDAADLQPGDADIRPRGDAADILELSR